MQRKGNLLHPVDLYCASYLGSLLLYHLQSQQNTLNQHIIFYKGKYFTFQGLKSLKKILFYYHF